MKKFTYRKQKIALKKKIDLSTFNDTQEADVA